MILSSPFKDFLLALEKNQRETIEKHVLTDTLHPRLQKIQEDLRRKVQFSVGDVEGYKHSWITVDETHDLSEKDWEKMAHTTTDSRTTWNLINPPGQHSERRDSIDWCFRNGLSVGIYEDAVVEFRKRVVPHLSYEYPPVVAPMYSNSWADANRDLSQRWIIDKPGTNKVRVTRSVLEKEVRKGDKRGELTELEIEKIAKRMMELLDAEALEEFCEDVEKTYGEGEKDIMARKLYEVYVVNITGSEVPVRELVVAETSDAAKMKGVAQSGVNMNEIESYDVLCDEIGPIRNAPKD